MHALLGRSPRVGQRRTGAMLSLAHSLPGCSLELSERPQQLDALFLHVVEE